MTTGPIGGMGPAGARIEVAGRPDFPPALLERLRILLATELAAGRVVLTARVCAQEGVEFVDGNCG